MGIYDRDYYRKEGPGFLASFTGQGKACKWLIAINVIFFVAQLMTPPAPRPRLPRVGRDEDGQPVLLMPDEAARETTFGDRFGVVQEALQLDGPSVLHGQIWRLLTYGFLHDATGSGGVMHILFNMLFLWWFGHEMEELYGFREFLMFYLGAVALGGVGYVAWAISQHDVRPCVGASGGVTGVMVLYAFHYPTRVIRLWLLLPIPIWLFVGFQVAQDTFIFARSIDTGTAVTAHMAGAAFGLVYYKFNWRLAPLWSALTRLKLPRRRPRLSVYRDDPPTPVRAPAARPTASAPVAEMDEHLEAKVDAVLEKVARSGRDSLTESEKQFLVRASEVYKRKQRS